MERAHVAIESDGQVFSMRRSPDRSASAPATRSSSPFALMVRLARITSTSVSPRVSMYVSLCGRMASTMRAVDSTPDWPRSGERKTGTSATAPAFSTRSPIRTRSPVTEISAFR